VFKDTERIFSLFADHSLPSACFEILEAGKTSFEVNLEYNVLLKPENIH